MPVNPSGVMHLVPGDRLDRYELVCPIANGGMAAVWLARLRAKHGFEKFFAVKTILPEYAANARFQDMLLDEARIAAGIDHTNVAHTFDLGEEHGVLYLVMECVDGDSLGKLSSAITNSGGAFPMNAAIRIMADVCAGLHAAHELRGRDGHELNVVHRDISPQNILVSRSGVVKVIDFGIARARDRIADETLTGAIKGKIQFMAPEQAMARPVDRRADVWAAGAVLYKLLSGRAPFDGLNKLETMQQMAAGMLPDPLPAEVPRAVAQVVETALASDPAERFPTALAMREALEAAMIGTGLQASSDQVATLVTTYLGERMDRRRHGVEAALHAADLRDADGAKKPASLRPRRNSDIPTAVINMRRDGAGTPQPVARTSAPRQQVARTSAPPQLIARTTEPSERALPAWGTTVFPLRPRMTRRVATTALAAVGAALLLFATVRRERPVRADMAKTPVAVAVAAPEIIAAPPISIDPPASAPLQAMTAEATASDAPPSPASLRQAKTTTAKPSETAKAKARREKRVKAAKSVTVPTRSDPVTDYYGF